MRDNLKFGVINSQEELEKVSSFASSFDHEVTNRSIMPVFTISRGDKLFSYFSILRQPVIFPAFHTDPKVCSPRDFREAFDAIRNHVLLSSINPATYPNGVMYMALPAHTEERYGKEQMKKVGLETNGSILYRTNG